MKEILIKMNYGFLSNLKKEPLFENINEEKKYQYRTQNNSFILQTLFNYVLTIFTI